MPPSHTCQIFLGAYPTGELAARLQDLRQQYDPRTARIIEPSVNLAGISS